MADPFEELLRQQEEKKLASKTKQDPFEVLLAAQDKPYSQMEAFRYGAVHDLPVVGPLAEEGYQAAAERLGYPGARDYAARAVAANPDYAMLGGTLSNTATMGPLGATRAGAIAMGGRALPALGRLGENIAVRTGIGGTTSAALGAADAAARGEDPLTGAVMGGTAGVAAPVVGGLMRGIVSPFNPLRRTIQQETGQPALDELQRAGIRLSAGDVTQSKPLRSFEDILRYYPGVGGTAEDVLTRPHADFTTAALRRVNPAIAPGTLATPDVLAREHAGVQNAYNRATAGVTLDTGSPEFRNDLYSALSDYTRGRLEGRDPNVIAWFERLNRMGSMGGLSGSEYQRFRTDLRLLRESSLGQQKASTPESEAFNAMRRALDEQVARSAGPDRAATLRDLNQRYGNLRTIEEAMSSTTQGAGKGFLSPAALAAAVKKRSADYSRAIGPDMVDLARAGQTIMRPLPESGTGRQAIAAGLLAAGGGAATGALGMRDEDQSASLGGATAGLIGAPLAAFVAGRAALSPAGQRFLMNRLLSTPRAVSLAVGPLQQSLLPGRTPTLERLGE